MEVIEKDVTGREARYSVERRDVDRSEALCVQCAEGGGVLYRAGCGREGNITQDIPRGLSIINYVLIVAMKRNIPT